MRYVYLVSSYLLAAAIAGCGSATSTPNEASSGSSSHGDHGHDHAHGHDHPSGEGHSHGDASGTNLGDSGHTHGIGPHGGTIADWGGGKFHVELTIDHDQQQATVHVLMGDEKTASPISAETIELAIREPKMLVTLQANPLDSDPSGKASRFVGQTEMLSVVGEYSGTITGIVDDTPYSGDFQEQHSH
ncbi:MAG: hypothetical protein AAF802_20035 [Planctomycetota bacterium]